MNEWTSRRVGVVGLGLTGASVLRWLARCGALPAIAVDTRASFTGAQPLREAFADVPMYCGTWPIDAFDRIDTLIVSPGVAPTVEPVAPCLARGVTVIGDVEVFARELAVRSPTTRVIGITGTNGKSTVTKMVGDMLERTGLRAATIGNIGTPVLDALNTFEDTGYPQAISLELSSFQLDTTQHLRTTAATVLNVTEDHLDRYGTMHAYAAAKAHVFDGCALQVLNRDDPRVCAMVRATLPQYWFGLAPPRGGNDWGLSADRSLLMRGDEPLLSLAELPVAGLHNAANALAALALTQALDLPLDARLAALRSFRGLPHRVVNVGEIDAVTFYDDSKGTNVGATLAALSGMTCPVVLIAGGEGKGQDFSPLAPVVKDKARAVVLIGKDAPAIEDALRASGKPIVRASSMRDAVRAALTAAQPGDAVLLSPACASLDMFENYAHRGRVFAQEVAVLTKERGAH